MQICSCNPVNEETGERFNDKAAKNYLLENEGRKIKVAEIYKACTGGEGACCGRCLPYLKQEHVDPHNKTVEQVQEMGQNITPSRQDQDSDHPPSETVEP